MGGSFRLSALVASLLLCSCGEVIVQNSERACAYDLQATLPLTIDHGLQIVTASINGQATRMALDTGSEGTVVFEKTAEARSMRTDWGRMTQVTGLNGMTVSHNVLAESFKLGDVAIGNLSVVVVPPGGAAPSPDKAFIEGLIGADVLSRFDIDVDASHQQLLLYRWRNCPTGKPNWHTDFVAVPLLPGRHKPLIVVAGRLDGKRVGAMSDSGSVQFRMLRESAIRLGVAAADLDRDQKASMGGLGPGDVSGSLHEFGSLEIPGARFTALKAVVLDEGIRAADVSIGYPLFRGRRVWISYASERMYLGPP